MKKILFILITTLTVMLPVRAQNSAVESEVLESQTKAEKFLKECSFYREDTFIEMEEEGLRAWAKVATNLVTNEKIGYCYFMTESKEALANFTGGLAGGSSQPLGYLDIDEIDDMINALRKIVDIASSNSSNEYTVNYITKTGIDVRYDSKEKKVTYSKTWKYINQYGVESTSTISSPDASIKSIQKTISMLTKATIILNHNLK